MNILGRNLLSLTVYHLRSVVRKVFGGPVISSISCVGDDLVVEGTGGRLGETITISLPGLPIGLGVVGTGGVWSVVFEGECSEDLPNPEDIIIDQTPTPEEPPYDPGIEITPAPGEDGGVIIGGEGGEPGDEVEIDIPGVGGGEGVVDEDGNWEIEIPGVDPEDIDPEDIEVVIRPPEPEPEVEEILCTFDSASIDGLGVGRGDTVIVTFPDSQVVETVANEEGRWSVSVMTEVCPLVDELEIEVIPNPDNVIIRPNDGILTEIAGYEFLESTEDGSYVAYELSDGGDGGDGGGRRIASISDDYFKIELPERHSDLYDNYSPVVSFYDGKYYIGGTKKLVITESLEDFENEVIVNTGLYTYEGGGIIYKGKHAGYFIISEPESTEDPTIVTKLMRHNLSDTGVRLVFSEKRFSRYHLSTYQGKDWFFKGDFSESFLIDNSGYNQGPIFDFELLNYSYNQSKIEWLSDEHFIATVAGSSSSLASIFDTTGELVSSFLNSGGRLFSHNGYTYYSRDSSIKKQKEGIEYDTNIRSHMSLVVGLDNLIVVKHGSASSTRFVYYIDDEVGVELAMFRTDFQGIELSPDYLIIYNRSNGIDLYPIVYE